MVKDLRWFDIFRDHGIYRDDQTVFCRGASCGSGLRGSGVHVVEDRNCAEPKLRELVGDYQAVMAHPFNDPLVIAG